MDGAQGTASTFLSMSAMCLPDTRELDEKQPVKTIEGGASLSVAVYSGTAQLIGRDRKKEPEVKTSLFSRVISVVLYPFKWLLENRFGLAKLAGAALVPSQFERVCDSELSALQANELCQTTFDDKRSYERVSVKDGDTELEAVICYPPGWHHKECETADCVVFNNPNGITVAGLFNLDNTLNESFLPGAIQQIKACPVILYDYRGTGMNKTSSAPWPTANTIVKDASAVLKYAAERFRFGHLTLAGSSLGGGVATASLERVLNESDSLTPDRVSLINHDSFTTSGRVVIPRFPRFADALAWLLGGNLNALKPMKKLINRKVSITVINNLGDHVIPHGARMLESVREMGDRPHIKTVDDCVPKVHAILTEKIYRELSESLGRPCPAASRSVEDEKAMKRVAQNTLRHDTDEESAESLDDLVLEDISRLFSDDESPQPEVVYNGRPDCQSETDDALFSHDMTSPQGCGDKDSILEEDVEQSRVEQGQWSMRLEKSATI